MSNKIGDRENPQPAFGGGAHHEETHDEHHDTMDHHDMMHEHHATDKEKSAFRR
jgi:hypothetical protein